MTGVLRWEAPPPHGNSGRAKKGPYALIADALRTRPGEWGVVAETSTGTAGALVHRVKSGRTAFAPAGTFEAVCRKQGDATLVYARYVGEVTS